MPGSRLVFLFLMLMTSCLTPSMIVVKELQKGDECFNANEYNQAMVHYSNVLEAGKNLGVYRNLRAEADVHRKLADAYIMKGNYPSAMDHALDAAKLDSLEGNILGIIDNTVLQGRIHFFMGDLRKGMSFLQKAASMAVGLEQSLKSVYRKRAAEIFLSLGQYHQVLGRLEEAIRNTMDAKKIFEEIHDEEALVIVYQDLAGIFLDRGDPDTAELMIRISVDKAEKLGLKPVNQYIILARVLSLRGKYEAAIEYGTRAMELSSETGILAQQIWAMISLGDMLIKTGKKEEGMNWILKARDTGISTGIEARGLETSYKLRTGMYQDAAGYYLSEGSTTGQAIAWLKAGEYSISEKNFVEAVSRLRISEELFEKGGNKFGAGKAELSLIRAYLQTADPDSCPVLIGKVLGMTDFPEILWEGFYLKGLLFEKEGKIREAIESYKRAVLIIEELRSGFTMNEFKSSFVNDKQEVYEHLIRLLFLEGEGVESFLYSERARARAFLDVIGSRNIRFSSDSDTGLVAREKEIRFSAMKLQQSLINSASGGEGLQTSREQLVEEINLVSREYTSLLQNLKRNAYRYYSVVSTEPFSIEELQSKLDEKTCILEYWPGSESTMVWIISKNSVKIVDLPVNRISIESSVLLARRFIASNAGERMDPALRSLYNAIVLPIEEVLENYSNWLIIPKSSLHFLPFQALIDRQGQYLVDRAVINYAPSASVWYVCQSQKPSEGHSFLGFGLGNLRIGQNDPLPSTESEVKEIAGLFDGSTTFFMENASESLFKKDAGKYRILHLASHGFTDFRNPLYSFILLAPDPEEDGRLNVWEIMETPLNANLVTLSACQTGLGVISEGDELQSLNRAFIYAGSPTVISSLWSVADFPTSVLMKNFYAASSRMELGKALTEAQRLLKKEYPSPFYWAPFVMNGDFDQVLE